MPVYEKCKVFTCNHTCNLPVIIDNVPLWVKGIRIVPNCHTLAGLPSTKPIKATFLYFINWYFWIQIPF